MSGKIKPCDNASNQQNANKGTDGVNKQYSQVHGNRGKQLNPNNSKNNWLEQGKLLNFFRRLNEEKYFSNRLFAYYTVFFL